MDEGRDEGVAQEQELVAREVKVAHSGGRGARCRNWEGLVSGVAGRRGTGVNCKRAVLPTD